MNEPSAPRRINLDVPATTHRGEMWVGSDLLEPAAERAAALSSGRILMVVDRAVHATVGAPFERALREAGREVACLQADGTDARKTRSVLAQLQDAALDVGIDRDTLVIAVGGGVVGDLAGFLAATLLRGLRMVQVPTTLLAMVDSAIGGKVGVNAPAGKNLLGALHHPALVVADVSVLKTLPDARLDEGLAEVIKYGVIADGDLFVDLEDGLLESCRARVAAALELVVERCASIKARIVAEDSQESGCRRILNFGHTVGHAVERCSEYEVAHGAAVAIGMAYESTIAVEQCAAPPELPERVRALCVRAELPVRLPDSLRAAALIEAMLSDKKNRGGEIHFALPTEIGAMHTAGGTWSCAVDAAVIERALSAK